MWVPPTSGGLKNTPRSARSSPPIRGVDIVAVQGQLPDVPDENPDPAILGSIGTADRKACRWCSAGWRRTCPMCPRLPAQDRAAIHAGAAGPANPRHAGAGAVRGRPEAIADVPPAAPGMAVRATSAMRSSLARPDAAAAVPWRNRRRTRQHAPGDIGFPVRSRSCAGRHPQDRGRRRLRGPGGLGRGRAAAHGCEPACWRAIWTPGSTAS